MDRMKKKAGKILSKGLVLLAILTIALTSGCSGTKKQQAEQKVDPQIFLYGEGHNEEDIQKKEIGIWKRYYDSGIRDLFVELSYFDAKMLNLWMKSDDNEILELLIQGWEGANVDEELERQFLTSIKETCPETVFHGTDVGHDYDTSGKWYLDYLEKGGQKGSKDFQRTQENIEQGKYFYDQDHDWAYRENKMVENFIKEYETVNGAPVMGIYGATHTDTGGMAYMSDSVPSMAAQLKEEYGNLLYTEDLMIQREEQMKIGDKEYTAYYYGQIGSDYFGDQYQSVDYWQLQDAYDDFKNNELGDSVLDENDAPFTMAAKRVYVLDFVFPYGTKERKYYRTDEKSFEKLGVAKEFVVG